MKTRLLAASLVLSSASLAGAFVPKRATLRPLMLPTYNGTLSIGADRTMLRDVVGRIEITGDDFTLDCDGHTITAAASGSCGSNGGEDCGIIIEGRSNVTLVDCHVSGHGIGMWISSSENIDVEWSSANENGRGYRVEDSNAVTISFSSGSENEQEGFVVRDSTYTMMWENTAYANGRDGFDENDGAHSYYLRNTSISNGFNGFELDFHEDADLSENDVLGNGQHGISLDGVNGGLLHDNYIIVSGEDGLRLDDGTVDFEVSDNYSASNGDEAAQQCASTCTGNVFTNNVFIGPTNNIP